MKIHALNTFSGILDLSAMERLQESDPLEKSPLRLYIKSGQTVEVSDKFYELTRVQDALRLGYIEIGNIPDVPSANKNLVDPSFIGTTLIQTAGENLLAGDLVYYKSDGKVYKTLANSLATIPCIGINTSTVVANTRATILINGLIRNSSVFHFTVGGQASQSNNSSLVYVSNISAGSVTQTLPSTSGNIVQLVGYALTPDVLKFDIDPTYIQIAGPIDATSSSSSSSEMYSESSISSISSFSSTSSSSSELYSQSSASSISSLSSHSSSSSEFYSESSSGFYSESSQSEPKSESSISSQSSSEQYSESSQSTPSSQSSISSSSSENYSESSQSTPSSQSSISSSSSSENYSESSQSTPSSQSSISSSSSSSSSENYSESSQSTPSSQSSISSSSSSSENYSESSQSAVIDSSSSSGYSPDAFITTWQVGDSESITLPLRSGFNYNMTVDWGDGSAISTITAYDDPDITHEYTNEGTYTVVIEGTCEAWYFTNTGSKLLFRTVEQWGDVGFTGTGFQQSFYGCSNATSFASPMPYMEITDLYRAWRGCSSITSFPDISNLTNVVRIEGAWQDCIVCSSFPDISSMIQLDNLRSAWQGCIGAETFPDISNLINVSSLRLAWAYCTGITTVPVLMTSSSALTTTQDMFSYVGAGMGGTVVRLWDTDNFPNISTYSGAFTGASGLDNYDDIPESWGGPSSSSSSSSSMDSSSSSASE